MGDSKSLLVRLECKDELAKWALHHGTSMKDAINIMCRDYMDRELNHVREIDEEVKKLREKIVAVALAGNNPFRELKKTLAAWRGEAFERVSPRDDAQYEAFGMVLEEIERLEEEAHISFANPLPHSEEKGC